MNNERFTEQEMSVAKNVDLCDVAERLGYTVKKVGNYYTLKEMDSIRIYNRSHWYRWSRQFDKGNNGGSQIDFLRVFAGMTVKEAVFWLLDFAGYRRINTLDNGKITHQIPEKKRQEETRQFILPIPAPDNSYLYSYLTKEREIRKEIVDFFVTQNLIYESRYYHNVVFLGKDKSGTTRFASMRGVFDKEGKPFKCDVKGNDKSYGINVSNMESDELVVFEAAIDLKSYMDIYDDYDSNKLALGMLADAPLETFLKENSRIKRIIFCLDNDEPGRKATALLMEKYSELGYATKDNPPPKGFKDYNDWLVDRKRNMKKIVAVKSPAKIGQCI